MTVTLTTSFGTFTGNKRDGYNEFLGIRYACAGRFEYPVPIDSYEENVDATRPGDSCPQTRQYYEHLENPERMFYHREFRDGIKFRYSEDCLNLNIYQPEDAAVPPKYPVIIFIYGGGFNSGSTEESSFDGAVYARRGIILVTIKYRVGVLGYLTHPDIRKQFGHDGNFGLSDQLTAIRWVKDHISEFGGDPENITLMGQSAGAMSIQYLCLSDECRGLFQHAVMMSGGGLFPKFSLPRKAEDTHEYWENYMFLAGVDSLSQLKGLEISKLFDAIEEIKKIRKDSTFNTMPVIDGTLIAGPVDELIRTPLDIDYMIGFTNNDMYAPLMAHIGKKFAADNNGYVYYFDIDAPGNDRNGAFHSSDLRYVFGTLERSFRPYDDTDRKVSEAMVDYISSFARTGDPNMPDHPQWTRKRGQALVIRRDCVKMGRPGMMKLLFNMITKGNPSYHSDSGNEQ